jgi:hypothetical protein
MAWSRSLKAMLPTADNSEASEPWVTAAVRTPRFCCTRGLMLTRPGSGAAPAAVLPPSPYTGTSIMSMKGDLAGLSNLLPGTMGSW